MVKDPLLNLYVYALQDNSGLFMGKDAREYADSIVRESFNIKSLETKTLASEAAVALNVWMYLAHILYKAVSDCKNGLMTDKDGIHAIDEAVAYWIGDGQIAGDAERGHLLYALAEEMGEAFQMDIQGQVRTNTNILRLFHQAKIELSLPNACVADPGTFGRIYHIVNKIFAQMTIPLLQALIHNLRQNDAARVKLYAQAVVPLLAPCSASTFSYLRDKLINAPLNVVDVEPIIDRILTTLPCLGLQCDDIGVHKSEIESSCTDPPVLTSMAGYKPASDVREVRLLPMFAACPSKTCALFAHFRYAPYGDSFLNLTWISVKLTSCCRWEPTKRPKNYTLMGSTFSRIPPTRMQDRQQVLASWQRHPLGPSSRNSIRLFVTMTETTSMQTR